MKTHTKKPVHPGKFFETSINKEVSARRDFGTKLAMNYPQRGNHMEQCYQEVGEE